MYLCRRIEKLSPQAFTWKWVGAWAMRALWRLRHLAAHLARKMPLRSEDESCFLPSATPQISAKIIRTGTAAPIMCISLWEKKKTKPQAALSLKISVRTPRAWKWICARQTDEENFNQRARGGVKTRNTDRRLAETRALSGAACVCLANLAENKLVRAQELIRRFPHKS